ncbi:flagellar assembly protein FlaE [Pleomorphomonas diazotrophica]|uniref:Flagellar hook protein FlgE n=1 Tax=Pleomorphomonas diazotrophica TaxID=1166257 RepID=A0A1I4R7H4_9HYPH|nr:flagellar hook-basal body complex protein [Pleomorphomonas diazotrophica]PKR90160.1 flagellar assembly protein FlaE [Pleomorphomonas diazotrophica]SFM47900.1 flagellar hook protein FlgE [Pleomorphomonas diazotrophica]
MGILTAMNSAVGGLGAQSFALENISGNIANSSTTGFKRKDTSFGDLVRSNTSNAARVTSGGVTANSRSTITLDGDIQGSKVDTHLAINGTGFFSVSADPLDNTLGTRYTRAGDFEQYYDSRNGQTYLRNASGYSLIGVNLTPAVGEDPKGPITIDKTSQSAKASTQITYKLNLPTEPVTTHSAANKTVAGANIYNPDWPSGAAAGPIPYQIANTGRVVGTQVSDFMDNSISGGTVTVYDAQGTPAVVQLRWAKFEETSTGRSEWGLFYRNLETYNSANTTDAVWTQIPSGTTITDGTLGRQAITDGTNAPGNAAWVETYASPVANPTGFFFDKNGKQLDSTSSLAITNLTVGGKNFGTMTLDMGATEFADKNGLASTSQLTQDGYSTGAFEGVSIDDNSGIVSYNYSNGQTVEKWKIPIVAFNGASYLKAEDGGAYTETIQSGSPIDIDGALSSSALEASNVDISEEFTKLIVTQQAFSANSKVITTADQMMSDILQIIR